MAGDGLRESEDVEDVMVDTRFPKSDARIENPPDPDAWTYEEINEMARRKLYIYPNRRIARDTRLECLRLAVQSDQHPDNVLKFARDYEKYLQGWVTIEPLKVVD